MEKDPLLSDSLALKGGTAINLTIFDLPRLSVDIDLDFSKEVERKVMLEERKKITEHIQKYMAAAGYQLSAKSKQYHALDSFVYEYVNAGGMKDNLKIEINYMLRAHVLPMSRRQVNLPWQKEPLTVLSIDYLEIFGAKIVALLNRTAARDLYDIFNLQKYGLFDESEEPLLRKCVVFYSAIAAEKAPECFTFNHIMQLAFEPSIVLFPEGNTRTTTALCVVASGWIAGYTKIKTAALFSAATLWLCVLKKPQ